MSVFLAALDAVTPHFGVRSYVLWLSQGHPFTRVEIDLRQVAAHKLPGPATLRLRLLRGRWASYSLAGFRMREIDALCSLLGRWESVNHRPRLPKA